MGRRLFGTDGIRGVAGEFLSAELALSLARATTEKAVQAGRDGRVLVLRDPRESGEMLEAAFAAGVAAAGGEALLAGVLPTPAAPLLVKRHELDLAAVISASHNPYQDNGIKIFGADGFKLSDADEADVEARMGEAPVPAPRVGRVRRLHGALEDYLRALHERFAGLDLSGRRIALDCANGATFQAAPEVFRRLGAAVDVIAAEPDGRNINDGVGSTHLEALQARVRVGGHDVGFAFDGDGDRVLGVDRHGAIVDGDELIALAATHLRASGRLGGGVAVTVMTNYGFHTAMADAGIEVAVTGVGDRYVLEALRERGWSLGGEQSGHIIDMGFNPTGDGIAAALLACEALGDGDLASRHAMEKLPQVLVNVRVADRDALQTAVEAIGADVRRETEVLQGRGRVLVRSSGTEPLVRVMVEAPTKDECQATCDRLVRAVTTAVSARS